MIVTVFKQFNRLAQVWLPLFSKVALQKPGDWGLNLSHDLDQKMPSFYALLDACMLLSSFSCYLWCIHCNFTLLLELTNQVYYLHSWWHKQSLVYRSPSYPEPFHELRSPNCDVVIMPHHWWRSGSDLMSSPKLWSSDRSHIQISMISHWVLYFITRILISSYI